MFGYEKGAFTGALGTKPDGWRWRTEARFSWMRFRNSIRRLQAKLLQLLQDGQFSRIGSQEDKKVEVRVVSATNRELHQEIDEGNFRNDLFYRIAAMMIHLPAVARAGS